MHVTQICRTGVMSYGCTCTHSGTFGIRCRAHIRHGVGGGVGVACLLYSGCGGRRLQSCSCGLQQKCVCSTSSGTTEVGLEEVLERQFCTIAGTRHISEAESPDAPAGSACYAQQRSGFKSCAQNSTHKDSSPSTIYKPYTRKSWCVVGVKDACN
jgi:hypothetical protein